MNRRRTCLTYLMLGLMAASSVAGWCEASTTASCCCGPHESAECGLSTCQMPSAQRDAQPPTTERITTSGAPEMIASPFLTLHDPIRRVTWQLVTVSHDMPALYLLDCTFRL